MLVEWEGIAKRDGPPLPPSPGVSPVLCRAAYMARDPHGQLFGIHSSNIHERYRHNPRYYRDNSTCEEMQARCMNGTHLVEIITHIFLLQSILPDNVYSYDGDARPSFQASFSDISFVTVVDLLRTKEGYKLYSSTVQARSVISSND